MKKEITPKSAIVIVLVVLIVIGAIYMAISASKPVQTEAPPPGVPIGSPAPSGAPSSPALPAPPK